MKSPRPLISALSALALLAALFAATPASADPTPEDKAQADVLFRDARALMAQKKFSAACGKFAESQRLDPAPGTLVNLALCHESEGRTASAWGEFNEVAERPGDDPARGPFARTRATELEKRLSKLRVAVAAAAEGEVVSIDERPHGSAAWGSPLPLDPGDHVVTAAAPGRIAWKQTVHLGAGPALVEVAVPALDVEKPVANAVGPARGPAPSSNDREPAAGRPTPTVKLVGYVAAGAGIVALGVGTYFGIHTLGVKSDADALCPNNKCAGDPRVASLDDEAKTSALVSTVAIGLGAAALVTGVVLVLTAPRGEARTASSALSLAPTVGSGGGGASLVGSF